MQTATQHQQPMMNPTLPPGYAYFTYGGGIMPGGFQYGTPAIYPVCILDTSLNCSPLDVEINEYSF